VVASDRLDPDASDLQNATAEIAWGHELTRDWSLNAGLQHSIARESGAAPVIENRLFATFDRRFSLRP
jgi:hypothetical protein